MSLFSNTTREGSRIAEDILKKKEQIYAQVRRVDEIKNSIEYIIGGTATNDDKKIIGIISSAVKKAEIAYKELDGASTCLMKWAKDGVFINPTTNTQSNRNSFFDILQQTVKDIPDNESEKYSRKTADEDAYKEEQVLSRF